MHTLLDLISELDRLPVYFRAVRGAHTQIDFAARLGITNVHLSRIETGKVTPTFSLVRRLADVAREMG